MSTQVKRNRYLCKLYDIEPVCFPAPPYKAVSWTAALRGCPNEPLTRNTRSSGLTVLHPDPCRELVIHASNIEHAQSALDTIMGCLLALAGYDFVGAMDDFQAYPLNPQTTREMHPDEALMASLGPRLYVRNMPFACFMAARVSRLKRAQFALEKLKRSYMAFSTHHEDRDPRRPHAANTQRSSLIATQTAKAQAIQLAYSCIEELGLHVPASKECPSRAEDGTWNQVTLAKFERSLRNAGIDPQERILWDIRAPRNRLSRYMPKLQQTGIEAPWVRGAVRDKEIPIADAVDYVSRLRSQVAAHVLGRKNRLVSLLTLHDVANAQDVARRLLMARVGVWEDWWLIVKKEWARLREEADRADSSREGEGVSPRQSRDPRATQTRKH